LDRLDEVVVEKVEADFLVGLPIVARISAVDLPVQDGTRRCHSRRTSGQALSAGRAAIFADGFLGSLRLLTKAWTAAPPGLRPRGPPVTNP
jgi:hypothetical protein